MLNLDISVLGAAYVAPADDAAPGGMLSAREPDYTGVIAAMQLRRMSKAVRMGIGAAKACLADAGVEAPDGIATGTGLGCLQDTEVFLKKLVQQEEQMLTPTSFIQSTHNTVAGQIALLNHCHGFNTTVSQHGHSFEGAFLAAAMHLVSNPGDKILCGGIDELTDTAFALMCRARVYTHTAAGEGAGFLLLGKASLPAKARVRGLLQFHSGDAESILQHLQSALGELAPARTALWTGPSGDTTAIYNGLAASLNLQPLNYKRASGDWPTAIAPALAKALGEWPQGQQRLIVVSNFGNDWSLWILEQSMDREA